MTNRAKLNEGHIPCPECGDGWLTTVKDTRAMTIDGRQGVRRRRTCTHCSTRITTIELPIEALTWQSEKMRIAQRLVTLVTEETLDAYSRSIDK